MNTFVSPVQPSLQFLRPLAPLHKKGYQIRLTLLKNGTLDVDGDVSTGHKSKLERRKFIIAESSVLVITGSVNCGANVAEYQMNVISNEILLIGCGG